MKAPRSWRALAGAAAICVFGGGLGADAADDPAGLIKYRQVLMQQAEATMAGMGVYMNGQIDFKPGFADQALALVATARDLANLFPPGSDKGAPTNAKPDVFANAQMFRGATMRLGQDVTRLAELAKAGDEAGFKAQFVVVVDRCGGCHERFRAPL
ncbi:MAG: cytochrome c [Rhodospirillaceae bacterium]|nr:cytochrome c [Rhodospirillaceae bacterium]